MKTQATTKATAFQEGAQDLRPEQAEGPVPGRRARGKVRGRDRQAQRPQRR